MPKISVVMSVFNTEKYLTEAIESILNQTFTDFEFIIIDDGSTDKSAEIIKSYEDPRIVFIQQVNKGLAAALNRGIKAAKGKYIARMDADDIAFPARLEQQYKFMENNQNSIVLGTQAAVMDKNGKVIYKSHVPLDNKLLKEGLPFKTPFFHPTIMMRGDVILYSGGYTEIPFAQDLFLWNNLAAYGEFRNLESILLYYRVTPAAATNRTRRIEKNLRKIIIKYSAGGRLDETDKKSLDNLKTTQKHLSPTSREALYYLKVGKTYLEHTESYNWARKYLFRAIQGKPLLWNAWFNLLLCYLPLNYVKKWKNKRIGNL